MRHWVFSVAVLACAVAHGQAPVQIDTAAAPGFYAYDGGRRFSGNKLMAFIRSRHEAGVVYVWRVTGPEVRIDGGTAWITYVNRGSITDVSGTRDVTWLESAVLRKEQDVWRIQFFHSTRVP
jgi:hypothetical protein